jgi:hypothetical protein
MLRQRGFVRELRWEIHCGIQRRSRFGPATGGTAAGDEALPVPLPILPIHVNGHGLNVPEGKELAACCGQQPARFDDGLLPKLIRFGTVALGEQIQLGAIGPATGHQGAHPWGAIGGVCGELLSAGRW